MPSQATKDWLACLEQEAQQREIYIDTDIEGRIFHFHLGNDPGIIGKVRYSEGKSRKYENKQGKKHIWHRYNRETELIDQGIERDVVNITLDVWEKSKYDPEEHHFIFLTERLLRDETYSKGDQKIWIEGDGQYSGPLAEYIDDWEVMFQYAAEKSSVPSGVPSEMGLTPEQSEDDRIAEADPSGTVSKSLRTQVRVSESFKDRVYEQFNHRCPLSGIEHPQMLTVSHILDRAGNIDLAEDLGNVVLLDWTHHMAFDSGFWTFDESGRIWVKPGFDTASPGLKSSLLNRHGEKVEELTSVSEEYIKRHNSTLQWWPLS